MPLQPDSVHIWQTPAGDHFLHWQTSDPGTRVAVEPLADGAEVSLDLPPGAPARARVRGLMPGARHYFRLADDRGTEVVAPARGLGLRGAVNFRDFGGYPTADGRRVAWGTLFRSGNLSRLAPAAVDALAGLAIDVVCDFRRETEQRLDPSRLPPGTRRVSIAITPGSQGSALKGGPGRIDDRAAMIEAMREINREFVRSQSERFREMFEQLLAPGTRRVLVHCAAGKDRTGFAAAMILLALGVPREAVVADYLLTRHYFDPAGELPWVREKYRVQHLADDDLLPMLDVDESYLGAALAAIESDFGSVEAYLEQALGVDAAARRELAARYLEAV